MKSKKKIIIIDPKRCIACRTCELQCATVHSKSKDLVKAINEKPLPEPRVKVESEEGITIPFQCRHCEDAPCVKICPTKALERPDEDSPVLINEDLCVGCGMCLVVCPFGVINISPKGKVAIKCDLCFERLKEGMEPACVVGCPTKALKFLPIEEVIKDKKKKYLVQFKKEKS